MVERAEEVSGLMRDGGDNVGIGIRGIEQDEGVVVLDPIPMIDRLRKPCEFAVLVERGCLPDENSGVRGVCRAFRHKEGVLSREFGIERGNDPGDAFRVEVGMFDLNIVYFQIQVRVMVLRQLPVEIQIDHLLFPFGNKHDPACGIGGKHILILRNTIRVAVRGLFRMNADRTVDFGQIREVDVCASFKVFHVLSPWVCYMLFLAWRMIFNLKLCSKTVMQDDSVSQVFP